MRYMKRAAARVWWTDEMMKLTAHLKPNSRHRSEVVENNDGTLTIYTKALAVEGRANVAAIRLIAEHFKVPKSHVKLIHGAASKIKIFEIDKTDQPNN